MAGLLAGGPLTAWSHGAAVVLEERFDAGQCLETLAAEHCSVLQMMPTMLEPLLAHPAFKTADRSRWRIAMVLTSAPSVLRMVVEKLGFRHTVCGYGMTESTALVTRTAWDWPLDKQIATNGTPLRDCQIRVVDPESGEDLPTGEQGEILIGGYCVMRGYYKKPEETKMALTPDGWLRTGDAGWLNDDGTLVFKGRLRDGYKHKGFNVSTAEVEAVLSAHPDIATSAVVGMPDASGGEIGIAFVVPRSGVTVSEAAVIDFLRPRLASFKLPARAFFVSELPRTGGTEKVQKFRLREMANGLLTDRFDV
jgi:acyl-CoA synthetase (AMP-forming)/AMP-acid ligase II